MVDKSCLVTDILPNNDICNKFGETWSEIIGDLFSSSNYSFFGEKKKVAIYFLVKNLGAFLLQKK